MRVSDYSDIRRLVFVCLLDFDITGWGWPVE